MLAATGAPRTLQYQRPKRDGCCGAQGARALQNSPLKLRGWRAAWRNPYGIRDPCEPRRAPLRRATCAQAAKRSRMLFLRRYFMAPFRTASHQWHRPRDCGLTRRPTRYSAAGRSGDSRGRNASSWRGVRACSFSSGSSVRTPSSGAAPPPASMSLMSYAPSTDEVHALYARFEARG
jgi:hypothetical protein